MIVLLLKQMHLQKEVALDLAAAVRCRRNRRRNAMVIVGDMDGRIVSRGLRVPESPQSWLEVRRSVY
jgi:hypothetical protein